MLLSILVIFSSCPIIVEPRQSQGDSKTNSENWQRPYTPIKSSNINNTATTIIAPPIINNNATVNIASPIINNTATGSIGSLITNNTANRSIGSEESGQNNKTSIYHGTAIENKHLSNQKYTEIVKNHFESLTPANSMKWDATEKNPGVYDFKAADEIVKFGKENGKTIRGHTGIWHDQIPQWVKNLDAKALVAAIQNHIKTLLKHFENDLYAFDVCNEVIGDDGNLRNSFWLEKLGDSYIEMAFQAAIDAGTKIKMYINDYSVEGPGNKSDALFKLAEKLSAKKLLHGVGFQAHMIVGKLPSLQDLKKNLQRFINLGLEVAYTEIDVRLPLPASPKDLAQQAKDYSTLVRACKETNGCRGVIFWGVGYPDSWVPSVFKGFGDALLFDKSYEPTQAFLAFQKAFKGEYTE
ncbi:hypothetical protein CROQUDRAFT_53314 [Cronartium quercuum f. sp. fusiforme G11]|uniref:Beta-xylanase n=1 Tax=Cronartium quercuum f. sp. fusiforme G11 TaxID=708437 RepID=A0A9P6NAF7_9BASI|nr:hypothetical protein CROQUDRAFT_53314 [Cronartium quercuum f. sp. fusiforme G11]